MISPKAEAVATPTLQSVGLIVGYTVLLTTLSLFRWQHWFATGWDLGFYQQGLWALWHRGPGAYSSMTGEPVIADTASFVLWLLAPFYHFLGTRFLLVLQSFSLGLGYWWIQQIGHDLEVSSAQSRLVGLVYLLFPALLAANLYDFHPDVLAVPLLFAAVHYALKERWLAYAVAVFLALTVKDMVAVAVVGLGISLVWGSARRVQMIGAATIVAGLAWLFATTAYLIPLLAGHPMSQWSAYYGQYGATPIQGVKTLLSHPWRFFGWAMAKRPWEYLVWIFGPLLGIVGLGVRKVGREARWIIAGLVVLEINCLSRFPAQTSPFDQYSLFALPSLFVSGLVGIRASSTWAATMKGPKGRFSRMMAMVESRRLAVALSISGIFLLVMAWHLHDTTWHGTPPNQPQLRYAASLIPRSSPVVAQNFLVPHTANRADVAVANTLGSVVLKRGTYVFLDEKFSTGTTPPAMVAQWTGFFAKHEKPIYRKDGVSLFKIVRTVPTGAPA